MQSMKSPSSLDPLTRLIKLGALCAPQPQACERNAERIALDGDRKVQMDNIDRLYRQLLA
jgi:hypothetical protein